MPAKPLNNVQPLLHLTMVLVFLVGGEAWAGGDRVSRSRHNLAVGGDRPTRDGNQQGGVCGFCHGLHNPMGGATCLWSQRESRASYRIYESSTLDARPRQPSGTSKMCLSCHDGTIAFGHPAGGQTRRVGRDVGPGAGLTNLGTDLSDDHPISFPYTTSLSQKDRQLLDPKLLPAETKLDGRGNLQCTTCHNPHDNSSGAFLTLSTRNGELCITCHRIDGWVNSTHRISPVSVVSRDPNQWPYTTVAQNACRSCHRPHSAKGKHRLRIFEREEDNCLSCHNGGSARSDSDPKSNILATLNKASAHDPRRYRDTHDPIETQPGTTPHVECSDCHNPHAVSPQRIRADGYTPIGSTLALVGGFNAAGTRLKTAHYEYEVCFRCHGDFDVPVRNRPSRQVLTGNLRLKFSATNVSAHPVVSELVNSDTVSLDPRMTRGQTKLRCTDCHNNDSGRQNGGAGPIGPHGSVHDFLLERQYTIADNTAESEASYALCYKCHRRTSILADESFAEHRSHVVDRKTPCAACHDPHGVPSERGSDHTHLINFDTSIVFESATGHREFKDLGHRSGSCTLRCHDLEHQKAYGR